MHYSTTLIMEQNIKSLMYNLLNVNNIIIINVMLPALLLDIRKHRVVQVLQTQVRWQSWDQASVDPWV